MNMGHTPTHTHIHILTCNVKYYGQCVLSYFYLLSSEICMRCHVPRNNNKNKHCAQLAIEAWMKTLNGRQVTGSHVVVFTWTNKQSPKERGKNSGTKGAKLRHTCAIVCMYVCMCVHLWVEATLEEIKQSWIDSYLMEQME